MPTFKKVHSPWLMVHRIKKETTNYEQLTTNRKSTGFTLIELLVVISIIGILASFITFAFTESQAKARDNRRKADVEAIRKALELAKQDSTGSYSYAACDTPAATIAGYNTTLVTNSCILTGSSSNPDLASTYIKAMPVDPKTNAGYVYKATPDTPTVCTYGSCTGFTIVACLENIKDPQREDLDNGAADKCGTGTTNGLVSYMVSNL